MHQQYPNAYRRPAYQSWVVYLARCKVCGYPCNGFLFIFVIIKLDTPLIQAHFVGSFRPVVRFVVILAAGFVNSYLFEPHYTSTT